MLGKPLSHKTPVALTPAEKSVASSSQQKRLILQNKPLQIQLEIEETL